MNPKVEQKRITLDHAVMAAFKKNEVREIKDVKSKNLKALITLDGGKTRWVIVPDIDPYYDKPFIEKVPNGSYLVQGKAVATFDDGDPHIFFSESNKYGCWHKPDTLFIPVYEKQK